MHLAEQSMLKGRGRGVALIWTSLMVMVLFSIMGLALDWAHVLFVANQLQISADAGALAAAQHIKTDQDLARLTAVNFAAANEAANSAVLVDSNGSNAPAGDIVLGRWDTDTSTFTPNTVGPNAVKVVARRTTGSLSGPLSLLFGPIFGVDTSEVARIAIAMNGGGTGAGLIALSSTEPCGLNLQGTVILEVSGGSVQVNSEQTNGVCANGNPTLIAPVIDVVGGENFIGAASYEGYMHEGADYEPDPLAFLEEPWPVLWTPVLPDPLVVTPVVVNAGESVTLNPGYYPGGITMNNGSITVLNPGIFIIGGTGLKVLGGDFFAHQVMFYIDEGELYLGGNGVIDITPPDPDLDAYDGSYTYEGVSIFQARDNFSDATIIGTSGMGIEGAIYFPNNHLDLGGTGGQIGTGLIANTINIFGTGDLTINYEGLAAAPGTKSFLVY